MESNFDTGGAFCIEGVIFKRPHFREGAGPHGARQPQIENYLPDKYIGPRGSNA
jgi:hypothetical protein